MQRLLWLLLAVLTAVLLILASGQQEIFGLARIDLAALVVKVVLIAVAASLVLMLLRERFSTALRSASIGAAAALLVVIGYTYWLDIKDAADRALVALGPDHAAARGQAVEIVGSGGGFPIVAQINGAHVAMALDTGASSVVLTQAAAKAAGLPLEVLAYTISIDTANGRARAAPVTLDRLAVGGIVERDVAALIAQPGQLRTSLLGMSFLRRLESWGVQGDRLLMRGKPEDTQAELRPRGSQESAAKPAAEIFQTQSRAAAAAAHGQAAPRMAR